MKKLLILGLLSVGLSVNAAEMSFITVLSSPVGSFNRLEVVDSAQPASASRVNFCTKVGTEGRVQLQGLDSASLGNLTLASDVVLGRSGSGDYVLNSISLNSGGAVKGSRLLANNVTVSGQGVGKSSNLYGTTLTVAGAKTKNLEVGEDVHVISNSLSSSSMVWSNEYQADAACSLTNQCQKQYLLKSTIKESAVVGCSDVAYRYRHKQECCPSWPNREDPVCYRRSYVWTKTLLPTYGNYKYVAVSDARDCTATSYTGGSGHVVYPAKVENYGFQGNITPVCNYTTQTEGAKCNPAVVGNGGCYLAIDSSSVFGYPGGWMDRLREECDNYGQTCSTWYKYNDYYCSWYNVQQWLGLECSANGPWVPYGWEAE